MKINLLDPGLLRPSGHHYDWNMRIANTLAASGHEVTVYGNLRAEPDALLGFDAAVGVERLFRLTPYLRNNDLDPICGEIERQLVGARMAAEDLARVAPADLWLWPTAFAYQLRACAMVDTDAKLSFCLHMPPNNELNIPFSEPGCWWRFAAKGLRNAGRKVRIGTTEPECLVAFRPFIEDLDPIKVPIPVDGAPTLRTELRTVGFFGAQSRQEQGGFLVAPLIELCLKAGLHVVTQLDTQVPLAFRDHPGLSVLGHNGDFPSKVEASDLLVAPYSWTRYVGRGSGIIWQAMASGIPCVAPRGTSFSRALARVGSVALFSKLAVDDIFGAILQAQGNYPALAAAAFQGATEWSQQNGLAQFVDVMVNSLC